LSKGTSSMAAISATLFLGMARPYNDRTDKSI
jgi:hypothetical protein